MAEIVYEIVTVPTVTPVTMPVDPTDAIPEALVLHVPPEVASVSEMVEPAHTEEAPDIAAGNAFTVTVVVAMQPVINV